MRKRTLEEELESILEIDEWEFEDERGIESFKDFMTERIGFGPIVKSGSLLILGRLKQLQTKIKNEKVEFQRIEKLIEMNEVPRNLIIRKEDYPI